MTKEEAFEKLTKLFPNRARSVEERISSWGEKPFVLYVGKSAPNKDFILIHGNSLEEVFAQLEKEHLNAS